MNSECIEVFYNASSQAYPYITFLMDTHGALVSSKVHYQIASVADWCKSLSLPVRAHDRQVRAELREMGINAQPPMSLALGVL